MYVPQGMPPISGTSFARIAAELGLTAPSRPRHRVRVPAQRAPRRAAEVVTR